MRTNLKDSGIRKLLLQGNTRTILKDSGIRKLLLQGNMRRTV
jgi:hypothetical protein